MLAADIPNLEVDVGQVDGRDILANGGNGIELWVKVRAEEGLDLLEQCCLSGVVESKKENGILWLVASAKVKSRLFVCALSYPLCLSHADRVISPDDTFLL